jgi:tRNA 2-thiouridine synthesizing protein A
MTLPREPFSAPAPDSHFDAGPAGCGELLMRLREAFADLPPGHVLHVKAHDSGVKEDLPAWCGMTGHALVHAAHPDYYIRRRDRP